MNKIIKAIEEIYLQILLTCRNNKYIRTNNAEAAKYFQEGVVDSGIHAMLLLKNHMNEKDVYQVKDNVLHYRGMEFPIGYDDYGMTQYVEFNGKTWCTNSELDMTDWLDHQILDRDLALDEDAYGKRVLELFNSIH